MPRNQLPSYPVISNVHVISRINPENTYAMGIAFAADYVHPEGAPSHYPAPIFGSFRMLSVLILMGDHLFRFGQGYYRGQINPVKCLNSLRYLIHQEKKICLDNSKVANRKIKSILSHGLQAEWKKKLDDLHIERAYWSGFADGFNQMWRDIPHGMDHVADNYWTSIDETMMGEHHVHRWLDHMSQPELPIPLPHQPPPEVAELVGPIQTLQLAEPEKHTDRN